MDKNFITKILLKFQYLPNSPVKDMTDKQIDSLVMSYYEALSDLPQDLIEAAASAYKATGRFFPAPGDLRNKAVDIALLAMDVPTEGEAWGMINQEAFFKQVRCPEGWELYESVGTQTGNAYWAAIARSKKHDDSCAICQGKVIHNWHPAVKSAFDALGGARAIFTDSPAADRARFTDNYRRFIEKEVLRLSMPTDTHGYIENQQAKLKQIEAGVGQVVMQLTNPKTGEKERLE